MDEEKKNGKIIPPSESADPPAEGVNGVSSPRAIPDHRLLFHCQTCAFCWRQSVADCEDEEKAGDGKEDEIEGDGDGGEREEQEEEKVDDQSSVAPGSHEALTFVFIDLGNWTSGSESPGKHCENHEQWFGGIEAIHR